jgi:hypothetical protein
MLFAASSMCISIGRAMCTACETHIVEQSRAEDAMAAREFRHKRRALVGIRGVKNWTKSGGNGLGALWEKGDVMGNLYYGN